MAEQPRMNANEPSAARGRNQRFRAMDRRWLAHPWACFAIRGTHFLPAGRAPTDVREAPRMKRGAPNVQLSTCNSQLSTADESGTLSGKQEVGG